MDEQTRLIKELADWLGHASKAPGLQALLRDTLIYVAQHPPSAEPVAIIDPDREAA